MSCSFITKPVRGPIKQSSYKVMINFLNSGQQKETEIT